MNIRVLLEKNAKSLMTSEKHIPFSEDWGSTFPDHGGVYVIWKGDVPSYVGETSGLSSRMTTDLKRPNNHAFTKKVSISTEITDSVALKSYIAETYKVSFVQVDLGRAEIEEYLILRWRNTLINKPTKRLLKGSQYSWVAPV